MHGLGNDFVIVDAREVPFAPTPSQAQRIADRHFGVGCDQLIVLEPPQDATAEVFMRIFNADGSQAEACGNATRCVADLLMQEAGTNAVTIETLAGLLKATREGAFIRVDMGPPRLDWQAIPLAREMDTTTLDFTFGPLNQPVAVNMGNPHVVFFVDNVDDVPLSEFGPEIEYDPLFPERANVSIVENRGGGELRLRVWERGAGITQACGSAACAAVVAASLRGLVERRARIELDGGVLTLEWDTNDHVLMTGAVSYVFAGHVFSPYSLEGSFDQEAD